MGPEIEAVLRLACTVCGVGILAGCMGVGGLYLGVEVYRDLLRRLQQ
jgi:hypothetical protein